MAKAREIEGFAEATSFAEAAALAVETRTDELFSFGEGVLDTSDIERVHDMRVASRRLRAALEIFAPCFPKQAHRRVLSDVKALADALGERRDPDVQMEALRGHLESIEPGDRRGVERLIARTGDRQTQGNDRLAAALRDADASGLRRRLD